MRITKQLQEKINKEWKNQTETLLKPLYEAQEEVVQSIKNNQKVALTTAAKEYPIIQNLIDYNAFFHKKSESGIDYFIECNYSKMLSKKEKDIIEEINQKLRETRQQRENELEKVLIELSYGKDITDIQTVFDKYNLKF